MADTLTLEEANSTIESQPNTLSLNEASAYPTTSATGAFGRAAATSVVPSFGALGGAKAGFALGETLGGGPEDPVADILGVGGAVIGSVVGSLLANKAQNAAIKAVAPDTYATLQKYQQQDLKNHPVATALGNLAGGIPAFQFGNPVKAAKGAAAIYKIAKGETTSAAEKILAKNLATQIGAGAAGGIVAPLIQAQKPTTGEITQSIAQTLLFGEPRFGGDVPAGVPDVRQPTKESETPNASGKRSPTEVSQLQVRPPVGEAAPLRQQGQAAQARPQGEAPQGGAARGSGTGGTQGNVQLTPALLVDGKPVTGGATHEQILDNVIKNPNVSATEATKATEAFNEDDNHVFVDATGKILDRQQAAKVAEAAGIKLAEPSRGLESEDLLPKKGAGELTPAKVIALPKEEFFTYMNSRPGGLTREAWRVGQSVKTPEQAAELKTLSDSLGDDFKQAMAAKDLDRAGFVAQKRQFLNEAYGAATGTGSAALGIKRENPGYESPLSVNEKGQLVFKAKPIEKPATPESVGAATRGSEEFSGGNPDIMGVRQQTREEQAKAGLPVVAEPGEGRNMQTTLDEGRAALVRDPAAPDKAAAEFEKTKRFNYPDFAVVRAKAEKVMAEGQQIRSRYGDESPEAEAYRKEAFKWSQLSKDMQTEWHKTGMAQQGATDIDTGNPLALEVEHHDNTGKEFTPEQRKVAGKKADAVRGKEKEANEAQEKLNAHLRKQTDSLSIEEAERAAQEAAWKTVREHAARQAEAENQQRVARQELETARQQVQVTATAKAKSAATDVTRKAAIDAAHKESQQRLAAAKQKAKAAQVQVDAESKARQAAVDRVRQMAADAAKQAVKERSQPEIKVWAGVKKYLDQGETNFDDIRKMVSTDLGMPMEKVTSLINKDRQTKRLADNVWKQQQDLRRFRQQAKQWVIDQGVPGYLRALQKIPKALFGLKVGFHGTVALGTHAPAVAFQPNFWGTYLNNFVKMYRMVGNSAYYEMQMQDLVRRGNYLMARRAGLVNDPFQVEDYNDPNVTLYAKFMLAPGQRGYSVLKTLRQDMFDQHWNNLPQTARTDEVAKAIADGVNHATGVVKARAPRAASLGLFAPRLEASRAAWLVVDPMKAAGTFLNWKNASVADKTFAIHQAKEKAYVMGTMLSLLAFNQAMLSLTGSKQKINIDNPMQSDWMKFKIAGMDLAYGNAMLTMARMPARLWQIRESSGGRLKNLIYPDEDTYTALGEYGRSQMSPFASLASTLWLKSDWEKRPLPNSNRPVPARLRAQGVKPYTWKEFGLEQVAPIPFEEALRDLYQNGWTAIGKAMATTAVMMGTGARLTDDVKATPHGTYVWTPPDLSAQPQANNNRSQAYTNLLQNIQP